MALSSVKIPVQSLTDVLARPEELPSVSQFRIASYNAWNLFGDRPDVHAPRPGEPAPDEQLDALAEMIVSLDADAIAFQEVQNEKVLGSLFRERVNPKLGAGVPKYTSFVCIPARDPRGINVAMATRLAVRGSITFHDREFGPSDEEAARFSRDLLGVEVYATPTYRFLMFVAHLKSKIGGDKATEKRLLEAREVRTILEEPQFGGNPYIDQDMVLCGDMNDDPDSQVAEVLTRGDKQGAKPLTDVFSGVLHTWPSQPNKKYKKTRLDYVLGSPTLQILDKKVHTGEPAPEASDHFPISATVRVK